jgi:TolB protein
MRPRFSLGFLALLTAGLAFWSAGLAAEPKDLIVHLSAGELPIKVNVTGSTPELNNLANIAFEAHGRYKREAAGAAQFDLRFTAVAPGQVRVDVRDKSGASVFSQIATGTNDHNALYRAADLAVKATSGLKGFFATRLAFVSTRAGKEDIYAGDLFLTEVNQITTDGATVLSPRWSPAGDKLIYTSYRSGFPDIYTADLATQRSDVFVSLNGTNSGAHFSPDGRHVAFLATVKEGTREIFVCDAQNSGSLNRLTRSDSVKTSPCWSPDGTRLVFSAGPQLYVISAAGGTPQPLAITGLNNNYAAEPDWSRAAPDKIAVTVRVRGESNYQVAVVSVAGNAEAKLVSKKIPSADVQEPVWLADGRHLICTAKSANVRVLYLLDTETGKATRLSQPSFRESSQAGVCGP